MGTKHYIQETFTASTGKKAKADYILPGGLGALVLIDANHSFGGLGVPGVPAIGQVFPNVAYDDAKALIPAGDLTTLQMILTANGGGSLTGRERSGKGGLHVAVRQDQPLGGNGIGINWQTSSALAAYLQTNWSHRYYIGIWERVTRTGTLISPAIPSLHLYSTTGSATANFQAIFDQSGVRGVTHDVDVGYAEGSRVAGAAPNVLGAAFRNLGTLRPKGAGGPIHPTVIPWGGMAAWSGFLSTTPAGALSRIFYRLYIEDLTVSGRTYAEVDAADYGLWQAAFAAGGRYYNDTFTDPATLAGA